jgi:hypothetical protein
MAGTTTHPRVSSKQATTPDALATATERIAELVKRKGLSSLEATFTVSESLSEQDAKAALQRLIEQRYLCQMDADLAQLLAQRLGVEVQWSHAKFSGNGEWVEGRGHE